MLLFKTNESSYFIFSFDLENIIASLMALVKFGFNLPTITFGLLFISADLDKKSLILNY